MAKFCRYDRIKKIKNDERGMVLVITLFVVILVMAWGVATLNITNNTKKISYNNVKSVQAYYLAEAGLEEALQKIKSDPLRTDFPFNLNLETGTIEVTKTGSVPGEITLTAVGQVEKYKKTLTAVLNIVNTGEDGFMAAPALYSLSDAPQGLQNVQIDGDLYFNHPVDLTANFNSAGNIYSIADISLSGSSSVKNIYTKGKVALSGNAKVLENVYAEGGVFGKQSSVLGTIYSDIQPADEGYIDFEIPDNLDSQPLTFIENFMKRWDFSSDEGHELTGNNININNLSPLPPGKTHYIIANNAKLTGGNGENADLVFYSDGDIIVQAEHFSGVTVVANKIEFANSNKLENSVFYVRDSFKNFNNISESSSVLFVSDKNIVLNSTLHGGIITRGTLKMGNGSKIIGSVIAGKIEANGHITIVFNDKILENIYWPFLPQSGYKITLTDWKDK